MIYGIERFLWENKKEIIIRFSVFQRALRKMSLKRRFESLRSSITLTFTPEIRNARRSLKR